MKDFNGKVAVITGAGRGIGRGIALRCAQEGMKVVLAGTSLEPLVKTGADLAALGAETLIIQTDVSRQEQVENLARKTIEAFGEAHLLVNNAGVALIKSVWESSLSDWEWVMGVNFWGVLHGVRAFIPVMMQQTGECHIVNVSSINGILAGAKKFAPYCTSKQAVVGLSESLYYELAQVAPHIKVSAYCPGQVDTDLTDCERNRPPELQNDPTSYQLTKDEQADWKELKQELSVGKSIEESADILFKGLQQDKLYIGVQDFGDQYDRIVLKLVQARADNIVNERNPELSG